MQQTDTQSVADLVNAGSKLGKKKRVGFIMPDIVIKELNKVTDKRGKSRFVTKAIAKAIDEEKRQSLNKRLVAEYKSFSRKASRISEEWHTFELNDWDKL